jgi:hypothetical protein
VTLRDLRAASPAELARLFAGGAPFDPDQLAGRVYPGVSLGLPRTLERLTWVKFAKAFARDPATGRIRGWNLRVVQDGLERPWRARERRGRPVTFGHFEVVRVAGGVVLDYRRGGSPLRPLALLRDPLVSLSGGSAELLLGRSLLALGRRQLATPSFFALSAHWSTLRVSHERSFDPRARWASLTRFASLRSGSLMAPRRRWPRTGRSRSAGSR